MSIFSMINDAVNDAALQAQTAAGQAPGAGQAQPGQPVDVEAALAAKLREKGDPALNWKTSIVDLMKLLDLDSSLDNRKALATELGYTGALDGSAEMNLWLHRRVMEELGRNGARVPDNIAH